MGVWPWEEDQERKKKKTSHEIRKVSEGGSVGGGGGDLAASRWDRKSCEMTAAQIRLSLEVIK